MNLYEITIKLKVQADDEDHAYEQALDQITDGQFTPDIAEITK